MSRRQRYGLGRIFRHARHGVPYGNYVVEFFVRGVQHRENSGTRDAQQALRILKARLGELAAGRPPAPQARQVTLKRLFDDLDARYAFEERPTRKNLPGHWAAWRAALGAGRLAADVSTAALERCVDAWRGTVKPATINRRLEALRRAYRLGARVTPPTVLHVPAFPPKLREDNVREGFLGDDTVMALLETIRASDAVLADFLEWFSWLGMRPGAIRDLEWTAVDRETGAVRLVRGQRANKGKPRWVPLSGPLAAIIERAWGRRVAYAQETGRLVPWIFWRRYVGHPRPGLVAGDPVRVVDYRKAWRHACRVVGCVGAIPYDLRRTAVRNLKRAGTDDSTCMAITGHKTRSMLERYHIVDGAAVAAALERTFAGRGPSEAADLRRILPGPGRQQRAGGGRKSATKRQS